MRKGSSKSEEKFLTKAEKLARLDRMMPLGSQPPPY
jgi:hypothetical protein